MQVNEKLENVKVLIADDHEDTLLLMKFVAESLGWEVVVARNANEIIDTINKSGEQGLDAIIADINYDKATLGQTDSKLSGISAARQIRKGGNDMPIVFVSAYVNSITREEARRVKAEIVSKPVEDIYKLFESVAALIEWHRAAIVKTYEGPERRINSVNQSSNFRRKTDKIESLDVLEKIQKV